VSKYKIIITLILFCFFQTTPSISLELKLPKKLGDLKKITEDIKKEIEKKEPEVKKEEVKKEEVKKEEVKKEEVKKKEVKKEEVKKKKSSGLTKILLTNNLTSSGSPIIYTIEHDLKNNNGQIFIEPADQPVSFNYKVLYDHIKLKTKVECKDDEVLFNKKCINKQYDTFFLAKMHDQAISNGEKTFTFLDGKSYKTQPKKLISKEREENEILFLKGQKEFEYNNSRVEGEIDIRTIKICDYVYCDDTEIINNTKGYIGRKKEGDGKSSRKEMFDRLYGKRINEEFARAHDRNLSTGSDIEDLENELKHWESMKKKGFVGIKWVSVANEPFYSIVKEKPGARNENYNSWIGVNGVQEGGPASLAGIQSGDIILEIDGTGPKNIKAYLKKNYSKTVDVKIWRDKKEITTRMEIGSKKVSDSEIGIYNMKIDDVKKELKKANDTAGKTFEFSIYGSSTDANYPVGRYPLEEINNSFVLNTKKINTLRDFIGNEVKLLVNESDVPYNTSTSQTYSNKERVWTIKFRDLDSYIGLRVGTFYAGRYSIEIFDDEKKETLEGPSGFYFFYKD